MSPSIRFAGETNSSQRKSSIYTVPAKKQKMNITQTYFLAHSARSKLSREAARGDHDLRLLVGHANMLDSLMIDLANAEQEQERWFNQSLSSARRQEEAEHEPAIMEEEEEEEQEEEDSDIEESRIEPISSAMEFDDEEDSGLALVRTTSHTPNSPPELTMEADSDSEDESMPPSPPSLSLDDLTSSFDKKTQSGFFSTSHQPTIIAAY